MNIDDFKAKHPKWNAAYEPPPIPIRNCDWVAWHDDYDGAPDGNGLLVHAASLEECSAQIEDLESDQ